MGTSRPAAADRRGTGDRRSRCLCIHYPERRCGFDRRLPSVGRLRRAYWRLLDRYRDDTRALAWVLAAVLALSLADLLLTLRALELGASEANPIMARLIGVSPVLAGAFKLAVSLAVLLAIWVLRRYRRVLEASLFLAGGLTLLLAYHLLGTALLTG